MGMYTPEHPFVTPMEIPNSALFEAVLTPDERGLRHLIEEQNIPINSTNSVGQTVAHIAASNGNMPVLRYILSKEPELVSAVDRWKQTPLHLAVEKGALETVKYLLDNCHADLSQLCGHLTTNNVLHIAAEAGQLSVLRYLIEEKNMDPDVPNSDGCPAAFLAANHDHLDIIKYLAENTKANLMTTDDDQRNILFMAASSFNGSLRLPKYLLDQRNLTIDVNWKDRRGLTVTHFACRFFHFPLIKYYVEEKHADLNIPDKGGKTPLHDAAEMNNLRLLEYFLWHGADPKMKDLRGRTALDVTTDPTVKEALEESIAKRTRRSLVEPMEPMSFLTRQLTAPISSWAKNAVTKSTELKAEEGNRLADIGLLRIHHILLIANSMLKNEKPRITSSPQEYVYDRIDPIAIDAVRSDSYD